MTDVCNSCGSPQDVLSCEHCPTLVCSRCRANHATVCKENQKVKNRGQGPTVSGVPQHVHRPGHETPADTPARRVVGSPDATIESLVSDALIRQVAEDLAFKGASTISGLPSAEDLDAAATEQTLSAQTINYKDAAEYLKTGTVPSAGLQMLIDLPADANIVGQIQDETIIVADDPDQTTTAILAENPLDTEKK